MTIGRRCYCLLAAALGIAAILLKTCCFEDYPIDQWDALTWVAAIGVTIAFTICGVLGCRNGSRQTTSDR